MNERERIIHLWFDMWLKQQDLGIDSIFTEDVIYTESWSPKYESRKTVKHWFDEWNTRGKVLVWDIKQFFHKENGEYQFLINLYTFLSFRLHLATVLHTDLK